MATLTIRKPITLAARLTSLEKTAAIKAETTGEKVVETLRINGVSVQSVVTPTYREGRFYKLFYVNGKRVAKGAIANKLLAA